MNNDFYKDVMKIHVCSERFVILTLDNVAFVNVYLPCYRTDNDRQVITDLLEEVKTNLVNINYTYLVVGGDTHWDPKKVSPIFEVLSSFNLELGLVLCDNLLDDTANLVTHSFEQVKLQRYTFIDHFFVSHVHSSFKPVLLTPLIDYRNFSDHLPIILSLNIDGAAMLNSFRTAAPINSDPNLTLFEKRCKLDLNWKRADRNLYYEHTRCSFEPLLQSIMDFKLLCTEGGTSFDSMLLSINAYHSQAVDSLINSSLETVPTFKF